MLIVKGKRFLYPKRHLVSPDGTIYWIRALRWMQNKTPGVYIPLELMERLGWTLTTPVLIWLKGDAIILRRMPEPQSHDVDTTAPKTWKEYDRERQISIFQEVK